MEATEHPQPGPGMGYQPRRFSRRYSPMGSSFGQTNTSILHHTKLGSYRPILLGSHSRATYRPDFNMALSQTWRHAGFRTQRANYLGCSILRAMSIGERIECLVYPAALSPKISVLEDLRTSSDESFNKRASSKFIVYNWKRASSRKTESDYYHYHKFGSTSLPIQI